MELRNLAVLLGLCLLAVTQCSEARHSMHRRDTDYDIFAADEASDDEGLQNDDNDEEKELPGASATVTTTPGVILTRPKTYEVKPGDDVRLECNVNPVDMAVQWYKDGELYFLNTIKTKDDERFSIAPDSKDMLIKGVEVSDAGQYKCDLAQDSPPVSIIHTIVILESPKIIRFSATNEGNVIEGSDLVLTCDVRGRPPPQIVWSRSGDNGNQRLGENDAEFIQNSVFMKNVRREHSGKYYCYAFNSAGNNQAELRVSVAAKPRVHVHKNIINSAINIEEVLQCSVHYENNPHIRWYKDGKLIEDSSSQYIISTRGTSSNLTLTPTSNEDFGVFTCEAENYIGKHNRSVEVVQRPVIVSLAAEEGKLSWSVNSHQPIVQIDAQLRAVGENGDGTWKRFEIPVPSSQGHEYEIIYDLNNKLDSGKYEAYVKVKNDVSWSDNVDPIVFDIDVKPQENADVEPQYIQHASVYRGAASMQSSTIMSTVLMYLLVRFL